MAGSAQLRAETGPAALYTRGQIRALEDCALRTLQIDGYTLMQRAAVAVVRLLRFRWPEASRIAVVCGGGNNGGDGLVIARLLAADGLQVRLALHGDGATLEGAAKRALADFSAGGGQICSLAECLDNAPELIIDALFGTGLARAVTGEAADIIETINACEAQVLSVDVPSGLCSDTGAILGIAVRAAATMSFIAHKPGLLTASGPDCCGDLLLDSLGIPASVFASQRSHVSSVSGMQQLARRPSRPASCHKGQCGHLLVIGGNRGHMGAALLAGHAGLRAGAGRVTVICHADNTGAMAATPELMVQASRHPETVEEWQQFDVIAIGPGLGRDQWARGILAAVLKLDMPLVIDADALNLLAESSDGARQLPRHSILTPHPAEAARLLGGDTMAIQNNRFAAAAALHRKYRAVVLLKGNGTIVHSTDSTTVVAAGNPGMAAAGMGDVLTGVVASLAGQGMSTAEAALGGAVLHAEAGDLAAAQFADGLMAGDLMEPIAGLSACHR